MIGTCGSLAAFATGHHHEGMTAGVTAVVAAVLGLIWLGLEHRRIRRLADRWYSEHPEVLRQRPAS